VHARVIADEVVSHAFSHGFHPDHSERLAAYWAEALGGPTTFSTAYGDETSVVRMHSGHGPHEEMDRRAIACFDQALTDVGMASGDGVRKALHDYFAWATTTTMSHYHRSADDVPDGLQIPRWSWDGLVAGTGIDDI
jgi:hemoglobin